MKTSLFYSALLSIANCQTSNYSNMAMSGYVGVTPAIGGTTYS